MNSNFPFTQQLSNNMQKFFLLLKDVYKEYLEEYFPIFVPNIDQVMSNFQKCQLYSWGNTILRSWLWIFYFWQIIEPEHGQSQNPPWQNHS